MSTMQERRRYMRGIWALDGMLDHSEFVRMTKDELRNLIGTPPDRLYEAEIRKACRVVARFITSPVSDDGNGDALGAAVEHLEALFEMDSEPGSDEAEPKPKAKGKPTRKRDPLPIASKMDL